MEQFKIKTDKNIPLHYHLIKVRWNKNKSKRAGQLKFGPSNFYDGNMPYFALKKRISNL